MITFENLATVDYNPITDEKVENELRIANIPVIKLPSYMNSEVKTSYIGHLNGFTFWRAWRYWVCTGKMPLPVAEELYRKHKNLNIRAGGHAGNLPPEQMAKTYDDSPERFVPFYHIDSQRGLCELSKIITEKISSPKKINQKGCNFK